MAVIHIEKANPEMNGLYQYINQQFLLEEFPEVDWVNREDDLGIEGLRKAKMSYMPTDFARKYLVRQRQCRKEREICHLEEFEKEKSIPLYRKCFLEDSDEFVTYYYKEKTAGNRILVQKTVLAKEMENSSLQILSMVHKNPYQVQIKNSAWQLDYLVAVATDPEYRGKGYARELIVKLLQEEAKEEKPITYLVPANSTVIGMYEKLGFSFIGNLPMYELKPGFKFDGTNGLWRRKCEDVPEDCERAALYMEQWLSYKYEMYTRRDAAYVSRLVKELASEDGHLDFLYKESKLVGLQAVWGLEKKEQRLLYAEEENAVKNGEKPWNMARVANLFALLSAFDLKAEIKEELQASGDGWYLLLDVEDPIVSENSGRFFWSMTDEITDEMLLEEHDDDAMENEEEEPGEDEESEDNEASEEDEGTEVPCLRTSPAELVSFLFGYESLETIWPDAGEEVKQLLKQIDIVQGVLLDEIV